MMTNDMEMGVIPGMELPNGKCEPSYPQKFVRAENPNRHGPTNEAAKHHDSSRIMIEVLGK